MIISTFRIPILQSQLDKIYLEAQKNLETLPKPLSTDPFVGLVHMISYFVKDASDNVEGTFEEDGLVQKVAAAQNRLKRTLRLLTPDFRPYKQSDELQNLPPMPVLDADGDDYGERSGGHQLVLYADQVLEKAVK